MRTQYQLTNPKKSSNKKLKRQYLHFEIHHNTNDSLGTHTFIYADNKKRKKVISLNEMDNECMMDEINRPCKSYVLSYSVPLKDFLKN